jgi:hypothetical protein
MLAGNRWPDRVLRFEPIGYMQILHDGTYMILIIDCEIFRRHQR